MRVVEAIRPAEPVSSDAHGNSCKHHNDENENRCATMDENNGTGEPVDEEDDGQYDEGDYDPEVEAEAVARELGNKIWAELGQSLDNTVSTLDIGARIEVAQPAPAVDRPAHRESPDIDKDTAPGDPSPEHLLPLPEVSERYPQPCSSLLPKFDMPPVLDPMIETIKTMLSLALSDPHVHYALMTTIVPGPVANGANLYTILSSSVMQGRVNPELAQPLSILISALASGSMLVSSEPPYALSSPLDFSTPNSSLKRKRDPADEGQTWEMHPAYNPSIQSTHPPYPARSRPSEELLARLQAATSDILRVLDPLLTVGQLLSQSAISSIQRQLHQVYSFVSTCPQPQQEENTGSGTLQEIGGLIQVIGILNGVPIAQSTEGSAYVDAGSPESTRIGRASNNTIGTSVYSCSTCPKAFNKLSYLRTHERTHSEGRPYRCEYAGCPASFARNHDLRRHEKSHERQMFRCRGCDRLFSRRDALRRHKTNEKAHDECREAPMDTSTVQHDGDPPRVTRVWQNHPEAGDWPKDAEFEDGEIQPDAIANARHIIGTLYTTLQRHVTKGLNTGAEVDLSNNQTPQALQPISQSEQSDPAKPLSPAASVDISQEDAVATGKETSNTLSGDPDFKGTSMLPGYGLDDEHASLLEHAIAAAAQAAQAQAEAEAALYEESYDDEEQDIEEWDEEGNEDVRDQEPTTGVAKLAC